MQTQKVQNAEFGPRELCREAVWSTTIPLGVRNDKSYKEDTKEHKEAATKETTKIFANLVAGRVANPKTQQEYIDKFLHQWHIKDEV